MKKVLATLALVAVSATGAFAQTAGQAVSGFLLTQGSTYGSFTCPSTATSPCFVQYGSSIPTTPASGTTGDVNVKQINGNTTSAGNGVSGTGVQRVTLASDGTGVVSPAQRTLVTLDVKTVTTGGTAVNALSAGHKTAGGFLSNPKGATIDLCINEIGTATGTTSSGDTTCIVPGASYKLAPASTAVSVVTSDSSHPFSGYGLN